MADNPFTKPTLALYNDDPPADDGTEVAANQIDYSKLKNELGDPLKTFSQAIADNAESAFAKTINTDSDQENAIAGSLAFTPSTLTISAGVVTQARSFHAIEVETGTADDLDNATPATGLKDGALLVLRQKTSGNTVTVKHAANANSGLFRLANSTDYALGATGMLMLIWDDTAKDWLEIARTELGSALPRGYIDGLVLSNSGLNDISIAAGTCRDSTNAQSLTHTAALVKEINANWAVDTTNGGFPSGLTVATSTWYHIFLIRKSDGTIDGGFDTSITATNLLADATDYTEYRRIGSVLTDSATATTITTFLQVGDWFFWDVQVSDLSNGTINTTETTITLTVPPDVRVIAHMGASAGTSGGVFNLFPLDTTAAAPVSTGPPAGHIGSGANEGHGFVQALTNTSKQIGARFGSGTATDSTITTYGWYDFRGRDA